MQQSVLSRPEAYLPKTKCSKMQTCPSGRRTANCSDKPSPQVYKVSSALASQDVLNKCLASVGISYIGIIQVLLVIHYSFYTILNHL